MIDGVLGTADSGVVSLVQDAAGSMKETAVAMITAIVPFAVAVLLAWRAFRWVVAHMDLVSVVPDYGAMSDEEWLRHKQYDYEAGVMDEDEEAEYEARHDRVYRSPEALAKKRLFDKRMGIG